MPALLAVPLARRTGYTVHMTDPEKIIAQAIWRHARGDPEALARQILDELHEAGYEVRPKPDLIPIRRNPE